MNPEDIKKAQDFESLDRLLEELSASDDDFDVPFDEEALKAIAAVSVPELSPMIQESFLEEVTEPAHLDGTELSDFESVEIEDLEFVATEQLLSILESLLFATDRPLSLALMKQAFKGTNIKNKDIKEALDTLASQYADPKRGVALEEVPGGYQLRTKLDNLKFLRSSVKPKVFKLSGPALEVLSIVAYNQPCTKNQMDEIRGVESGHLLRALMERNLVAFEGKSDLPGRPMLYTTTKKFLEVFGLRNIKELPSLQEIDQLIPQGIEPETSEKPVLADITQNMAQEIGSSYSESEEELMSISDQLVKIDTSSEFFEEEKRRQKAQAEMERARTLREAVMLGDAITDKDKRWLEKYEAAQSLSTMESADRMPSQAAEVIPPANPDPSPQGNSPE